MSSRSGARGSGGRPAGSAPAGRWSATRLGVGVAVGAYGLSFGALATTSGLSIAQACALSVLTFTGGSQFALVGVIGAGGSPAAGIVSALLLGVRNSLYGLRLAPTLRVTGGRRLVAAHLVIDESTAMAVAQDEDRAARLGFWSTGLAVFVCWNLATLIGAVGATALGDPEALGPGCRGGRGLPRPALAAAHGARPVDHGARRRRRRPGPDAALPGRRARAGRRAGRRHRRPADPGARRDDPVDRGARDLAGVVPAQAGRAVSARAAAGLPPDAADRRPAAGGAAGGAHRGAGVGVWADPRPGRPGGGLRLRRGGVDPAGAVPGGRHRIRGGGRGGLASRRCALG